MKVQVFKTNIMTYRSVEKVKTVIDKHFKSRFSVDIEDEDHVMRIETENEVPENMIIRLTERVGYRCEVLTD